MISERRAFLADMAKEEEQLIFLQMRRELLTELLKNKYASSEGVAQDLQVARAGALPSCDKSARDFLFRVTGSEGRQIARSGIRHNYAADRKEKLRADIPVIEEEVRELIALRAATAKALDEKRPKREHTRREMAEYIGTFHENAAAALNAYEKADREQRLLANAAESGHTYYTYLRGLTRQMLGARATANRPIGERPYFDIVLQRAYTQQGAMWSESAESLQLEFLTDLRTLDAMTTNKFRTAGQIAFSPHFFDGTLTKLLTLRKGDELYQLLEQATDELATLLLAVGEAELEAKKARARAAEHAGLAIHEPERGTS